MSSDLGSDLEPIYGDVPRANPKPRVPPARPLSAEATEAAEEQPDLESEGPSVRPPLALVRSKNGDRPPAAAHAFGCTDLGNAERLAAEHGADILYCFPWKRWLVWDDHRWAVDETGEIMRRAKETVRGIYSEASASDDADERKRLAGHAKRSEAEARIKAMVDLARSEVGIAVTPDQLDADPWLLNLANGTLDLRSVELRKPRREDLLTKRAPVAFDPNAKCPTWDAFLHRILAGNTDLIDFMARAIGYGLAGVPREQVLFFLYGRGANGKTTLLNTILALVGDYGIQAESNLLLTRFGEAHPTGLADLFGVRIAVCVEVDEGRQLAESLVKQLTGRDRIRARRMRQDFFQFAPTHTLFLAANHKPEVRGTDHAIWRRLPLIPFTVEIPEAEQDETLPEKLIAELPGILNWTLGGCREWQERGLVTPEDVRAATATYRREQDVLADFLDDRCVIDETEMVRVGELNKAYMAWCEENGIPARDRLSEKALAMRLQERGYGSHRTAGTRWRLGLALRNGDEAL